MRVYYRSPESAGLNLEEQMGADFSYATDVWHWEMTRAYRLRLDLWYYPHIRGVTESRGESR